MPVSYKLLDYLQEFEDSQVNVMAALTKDPGRLRRAEMDIRDFIRGIRG